MTIRPVAVGYYRAQDRGNLVRAVVGARLPEGTPVYLGTYGVGAADSQAAQSIPGGKYAPIVTPQAKQYPVRRLAPDLAAKLPPSRARYSGALPPLSELAPGQRFEWGVEMGQRIRDQLRAAQAGGIKVQSFQLDEVWPSASAGGQKTAETLPYMSGVLQGVRLGRPILGDRPMTGLVHLAHPVALASLPHDAAFNTFLDELDQTASQVIGESYVSFSGSPQAAAARQMAAARQLLGDGPHGKSLAAKYMVGLTPGNKPLPSLGGRVAGQTSSEEAQWRVQFIQSLVREGAAGISEYNWTPSVGQAVAESNADPSLMNQVFREIARSIKG